MSPRTRANGRTLCSFAVVILLLAIATACNRDAEGTKARYIASGDRYSAAGQYPEAVLEYRNAVQAAPRAGDARKKLAEAYVRTGNVPNALGEYVRAADLLPDDSSLQLKAGNLLLLAGRFDDAKTRGEAVLAKDKENVDAEILVANALSGLKDLDGAVAQIEDALKLDPDRSATYSSLGQIELSRGKRDAAEKAFLKAVERAPRSAAPQLALGHFYWLTGDAPRAEASFKSALAVDARNPLANRILGNFYIASGHAADAQPYLAGGVRPHQIAASRVCSCRLLRLEGERGRGERSSAAARHEYRRIGHGKRAARRARLQERSS